MRKKTSIFASVLYSFDRFFKQMFGIIQTPRGLAWGLDLAHAHGRSLGVCGDSCRGRHSVCHMGNVVAPVSGCRINRTHGLDSANMIRLLIREGDCISYELVANVRGRTIIYTKNAANNKNPKALELSAAFGFFLLHLSIYRTVTADCGKETTSCRYVKGHCAKQTESIAAQAFSAAHRPKSKTVWR
jgi:hypothetical protein